MKRIQRFAKEEMGMASADWGEEGDGADDEEYEERYHRVEPGGGAWQQIPGAGWVFRSGTYLAAETLMHELPSAMALSRDITLRDLHFSAAANGIRPPIRD